MMHPFLRNLHLEIYGGSHDEKIGVRLIGLPAGEKIDIDELHAFLARRAPGSTKYGTRRKEADTPHFLSGMENDTLTGEILEAVIYNTNMRSGDYPAVPDVPRPSHADFAALMKYGDAVDLRGGGHFSGRLTAPLCIAGGIARQILARQGIRIGAHIASVGNVQDRSFDPIAVSEADFDAVLAHDFPVMDPDIGERMKALIDEVRMDCDSIGGVIECAAIGLKPGLGEHMFWGMENRISHLLFGVPAVKGIEFGEGFAITKMRGSAANDPFSTDGERIFTTTNHSGGIQGGMTNGMPLLFRCAIKPTPSIAKEQNSVSLSRMESAKLTIGGRHDPCIAPRAVPVIEAVAALAILDALLDPMLL